MSATATPTTKPCPHGLVTSTVQIGPHCADCGEPLVSLFWPIPRNTLAGALIHTLRATQPQNKQS